MVEKYQSPKTIIIGDFNRKVGSQSRGEEETLGPHGYGTRNERCDRLVQFAQEQRMKIANTFFRKSPNQRCTWQSPDCNTRNKIDYDLSNGMDYIKNIEVVQNLQFETDHRMLWVTIQLKRKCFFDKAPKPNMDTLDINKFQTELHSQLSQENFSIDRSVEAHYNLLEKCILNAGNLRTRKITITKPKYHLRQTSIALIKRREKLQHLMLSSARNKAEYAKLDKATKREICKDIRNHRTAIMRQIMEDARSTRKVRLALNRGKQ
jgi:hypothetical protein